MSVSPTENAHVDILDSEISTRTPRDNEISTYKDIGMTTQYDGDTERERKKKKKTADETVFP